MYQILCNLYSHICMVLFPTTVSIRHSGQPGKWMDLVLWQTHIPQLSLSLGLLLNYYTYQSTTICLTLN